MSESGTSAEAPQPERTVRSEADGPTAALRPSLRALAATPPDVDLAEAGAIAERWFGIRGDMALLDSERDRNFRIRIADGNAYVLKIANSAEDEAFIDLQVAALEHIARVDPGLPIPRVMAAADGRSWVPVATSDGLTHPVRLLSYLEGGQPHVCVLPLTALPGFGAIVARTGRALRGLIHPAASNALLWDVRHGSDLRPLLAEIDDPARRAMVERVVDRFDDHVEAALAGLRAQVIHNDLTCDNVLVDERRRVVGILDFGDMAQTALVIDLAVSAASQMGGRRDPFEAAAAIVRGYDGVTRLEPEELDLLPDLIATRLTALVAISTWRVRMYPENAAYIQISDDEGWPLLERFDALGPGGVRASFERAMELGRRPVGSATDRGTSGAATADLVRRRRTVLGSAISPLTYRTPLHLDRGEGVWLFDVDGRRYLDVYNNVPVVGHGHPQVVEAIARQAARLNTNARYLYEPIVELAERLVAAMPPGLDTCLFVNSGSEANDLAWRLAVAATDGSGAVVTEHAYHGVTTVTADLSPEEWVEATRPDHIETIPAPDGYRGPYRREEPGWAERYAATLDDVAQTLGGRGHRLAAAYLDGGLTSDGVLAPPPAYARGLVERTHVAGGLFVADEVQAGHGRTGSHLWAFAAAGAVPDIVTTGKPMGNGFPVAAVITRGEIVDRLAKRTEWFSTFGGNPVACAAALAVLDVIEDEGLVANAAAVGTYLLGRLGELAGHHEPVGDVRGTGLLIGVELVADRSSREPAGRLATDVAEALRDRGVLVGTTGRDGNVIKIRPPLVFRREHADLLVEQMDEVLTELAGR